LQGDFRSVGIAAANLDKVTAADKAKIEQLAREANLRHRRRFVDRFEQQFRTKMQGGPGRWLPNAYESDCYTMLGLKPPDTVQKAPEQREEKQIVIQQNVDPDVLAQLVAAEVAKITAATKR
jgi:hypothetical protein